MSAVPLPKVVDTLGGRQYPFMLGGFASALATIITHPLDMTKVQMQIATGSRSTTFQTLGGIIARHGPRGAYDGLSAAILRSLTYSTCRFGLYEIAKTNLLPKDPSLARMLAASIGAGGVAGLVGSPVEVVLVRMASDRMRTEATRYAYKNCFQGLYQVYRDEGFAGYYRGVSPNVTRAVLMNSSQLASYDYFKSRLSPFFEKPDSSNLQLLSSFLAGTVATSQSTAYRKAQILPLIERVPALLVAVCAPADVLKSRMMAVRAGSASLSMPAIIITAAREHGLPFFFKGWTAAWIRLCPQTVLTLIFLERLRDAVDMYRSRG